MGAGRKTVADEMRKQRYQDTYENSKKVPGASESPSAKAAMEAQKKKQTATQGAKDSPSVTAAMEAQKKNDAAKQNQLLQSMLRDRQNDAYNKRQQSETPANDTIYEKYLAGYTKLRNRLNSDARDTTSKKAVQTEIDKYIAQLDDPKAEVTRDGLYQYIAYTNQTDKYRDLLLRVNEKPGTTVNRAYDPNTGERRVDEDTYSYTPTGSLANLTNKQIDNISTAQDAYRLSVDIAKQINAVAPNSIKTGVIGQEKNAITGEAVPIYGYVVAVSNPEIKELTGMLGKVNRRLVAILNAEYKAEEKEVKETGAANISEYTTASSAYYDMNRIAYNLVAAQYKAFYLQNKYNADLKM